MALTGRVLIDEATFDGRDVGYDDFRFGSAVVQENGPVPEPTTILLLGLGLAGLRFTRRRLH